MALLPIFQSALRLSSAVLLRAKGQKREKKKEKKATNQKNDQKRKKRQNKNKKNLRGGWPWYKNFNSAEQNMTFPPRCAKKWREKRKTPKNAIVGAETLQFFYFFRLKVTILSPPQAPDFFVFFGVFGGPCCVADTKVAAGP